MKKLLLKLIDIYRKYLSPMKRAPSCRFYPTCSSYAYQAIEEWGAIIGLSLAVFRILRCNPLFRGGRDDVPLGGAKKRSVGGYVVFYGRDPSGHHCRQ